MSKGCFTLVYELDHEPENGKFRDTIVEDKANNILYFYDNCGAWAPATSSFVEGNSQTLSWDPVNRLLTISDGNTINIPSDNTDNQTLSYDAGLNELSIENGNTVSLQSVDPLLMPYNGTFIVSGGEITPGIGLQANVSNITYFFNGQRRTSNNIPTQVLQPTVDTYLVVDGMTGEVEQIAVGHTDPPAQLPTGKLWLGWVRSQAVSVTNTQDLRLMRGRGYAARFEISNTFTVPRNTDVIVPYNRVGSRGYRFGYPYRDQTGVTGAHVIPITGIYDVSAQLWTGSLAGTYPIDLKVFVNGNFAAYLDRGNKGGQRAGGGTDAATNARIDVLGATSVSLQAGDTLSIVTSHGIPGGARTFGQTGYVTFNLVNY